MTTARRSYDSSTLVVSTLVATDGAAQGDQSNDANPAAFAARSITVPVDFGDARSDLAITTVAGVPWLNNGTPRIVQVAGRPDVSAERCEDALLEGVTAIVTNITDGVSFDVVAHAPHGTGGIYNVHIVGV